MKKELEKYYKDNYSELCKRAHFRCRDKVDPEDIVQEAFTRALEFLDSYNPNLKPFGAWFNTILNNSIRDHLRHEHIYGFSVEYDEFLDEPYTPKEEERQMFNLIKQRIAEKGDVYSDILYLYFLCEYRPREIAKIVDATGANIRKIVERFKKDIQEEFAL